MGFPTSGMNILYSPHVLRLHGLRHLDTSVIRVFLHLLEKRQETGLRWVLGDDDSQETDLILINPDNELVRSSFCPSQRIAWVIGQDAPLPQDGHPVLRRPLQLEDFARLLKAEASLAAPVAQRTVLDRLSVNSPVRVRLQRWPQARSLAVHRAFPRLASLLVARPLTPLELMRTSAVEASLCMAFLHVMELHGVLELLPSSGSGVLVVPEEESGAAASGLPNTEAPETAAPPQTPAVQTAQTAQIGPAASAPLGLISRLRSRLGLS
jgi:hypothetical protein